MSRKIDLTGQTFNRLFVLSEEGLDNYGQVTWLCKCICDESKTVVVRGRDLRTGHTRSCGCLNKETLRNLTSTHRLSKHPLYEVWCSMKKRCLNSNSKKYINYGGRGITVCDRWKDSFENFYSDVIEGYQEGLELDRINNDGNYEPNNVRWATSQQNSMNRRGHKNSSSKYKGVSWNKGIEKWVSNIMYEKKLINLGSFVCEIEAAKAYNFKAQELFGEYAYLNTIEEPL